MKQQREHKEKKGPGDRGDDKRLEGNILEMLKRVGALGAAFKPEDIVVNLLEQFKAQKRELTSSMKSELRHYLSGINLTREIEKILDQYDISVDAKFSFRRKDGKDGGGRGKSE